MCAESQQFKSAEQTARLAEIITWRAHKIIIVAVLVTPRGESSFEAPVIHDPHP